MEPIVIVAAVLCFFTLLLKLLTSFRGGTVSRGKEGESAVFHELRRSLDEHHYRIFNDVMIHTQKGITTQIDHIVVSQYGVFVIETKNISGWIFASERGRQWTQTLPAWDGWGSSEKYHFQNPLRQNYLHIATLAYQLRIPKHHIIGLVAFPDETEFKKGYPQGVYTYSQIAAQILAYKEKVFDVETTRAIARSISAADAKVTGEERAKHVSNLRLVHDQLD